jgi:hypothetical protein
MQPGQVELLGAAQAGFQVGAVDDGARVGLRQLVGVEPEGLQLQRVVTAFGEQQAVGCL